MVEGEEGRDGEDDDGQILEFVCFYCVNLRLLTFQRCNISSFMLN